MENSMQVQTMDKIPPVDTVFDLKSGARAKLVYRSGAMVIIEVGKHRSDWTEWSEVEPRIAKASEVCRENFVLYDQVIFSSEMDRTGRA